MFSHRHLPRVLLWNCHASEWLNPFEVDHPELDVTAVVTGPYQLITGYGDIVDFPPADGNTVQSIDGLPANKSQHVHGAREETVSPCQLITGYGDIVDFSP